MGYYQQTLIIPKPTQRLSDGRAGYRRPSPPVRRDANKNSGINSILAYFN
ncbi:MAG: hypothetical protein Q4Q58_00120 [Thermoplasmata archaeon]|nr:hypothetical protein [Thermoplasmata archaeon]